MRKMTILTAAVLCSLTFSSCSKNEIADKLPIDNTDGVPTAVNIKLVQPKTYGPGSETEAGTPDESVINVLELYVFDASGNPDPQVGNSAAAGQPLNGKGYTKITSLDQETLATTVIVTGAAPATSTIVAVVNMEPSIGVVADYAALKAKLASGLYTADATNGWNSRSEAGIGNGFEMSGVTTIAIATNGSTDVPITVNRLASKIYAPTFLASQSAPGGAKTGLSISDEKLVKLWEGTDLDAVKAKLAVNTDPIQSILTFKALGYAVINGRSKSDVLFVGNSSMNDMLTEGTPAVPKWNTWSGTNKDQLHSSFATDGMYTNNYSGPQGLDNDQKAVVGQENGYFLDLTLTVTEAEEKDAHRVYVYENKPEAILSGGYKSNSVVSFIIKGDIIVDGDDANVDGLNRIRYWRVDIVKDDNYHVFRNCVYHINIKNITTIGYGTPKGAENGGGVIPGVDEAAAEIELFIAPWRLYNYETEM